jgi:hypothetical protein
VYDSEVQEAAESGTGTKEGKEVATTDSDLKTKEQQTIYFNSIYMI